jgi:hypothetical protein
MMNTSSPMKSPVMKQHDPDDDPFAALSAAVDANALPVPANFGSGAAPSSPKKTGETLSPKDDSK